MKTESLEKAYQDVATKLKILRSGKGFTTSEAFARMYDLPLEFYSKMENGKGNITLKSLLRILAIHDLSLEEFFCNDVKAVAA